MYLRSDFLKKIFLILLFLIFITACGTNRTIQNNNSTTIIPTPTVTTLEEGKASDYFAFTKDIHKIFKGTGNEYAGYDSYVDFIKDNVAQERISNGGTTSVGVYVLSEGAIKKVFNQGETYYCYDYTASTNMDEIIIKEPIREGTSWNLSDGAVRSISAIDKKVGTEFGIYNALEITTKSTNSTIKDYYVKDIGHVKSEFSSGDDTNLVTSELSKVETGIPYIQNISFYFLDFSKESIVFINRNIEFKTNDDMKLIFEKELKTIPENSGLAKVLTPNVKILGITLDDKSNTVTVDFSNQLVKEMNAGSSFESLILRCITNTFGTYYQKENVIITMEGKPYESGHFILQPGESYKVKTDDVKEFKTP